MNMSKKHIGTAVLVFGISNQQWSNLTGNRVAQGDPPQAARRGFTNARKTPLPP